MNSTTTSQIWDFNYINFLQSTKQQLFQLLETKQTKSMNALSLVLISLNCVPYISKNPTSTNPCVADFFLIHKSQLIIKRIVCNTSAKAK